MPELQFKVGDKVEFNYGSGVCDAVVRAVDPGNDRSPYFVESPGTGGDPLDFDWVGPGEVRAIPSPLPVAATPPPAFKVGDRVRVIATPETLYRERGIQHDRAGKEGVVNSLDSPCVQHGKRLPIGVEIDGVAYSLSFLPDDLELISVPAVCPEPAPTCPLACCPDDLCDEHDCCEDVAECIESVYDDGYGDGYDDGREEAVDTIAMFIASLISHAGGGGE